MKYSMTEQVKGFNTGDCWIEVTTWTGLAVRWKQTYKKFLQRKCKTDPKQKFINHEKAGYLKVFRW